ncbi:hypothetical protein C0033_08870 [Clostridium sp. chh4-2]|uniref:phage neck terminator protein n=1 Tax=Clostridium sp. chh4-2 TaxID=2067550 RepID=UPI000CCE895E|nr:hypothetical protein [Clostridium sp. chh4-2]PNV62215.1 hypothetical protein C0033_08870 [Clostridium sp. chh4-2]
MIDQEKINIVIAGGLNAVTGCEIVKSNLANARIPPYPYISFTVLNTDTKKGTYSVSGGQQYMPITQTWSFTVQGDRDNEAQMVAMKAKDWLEESGRLYLNDNGIVVQSVGAITSRDTLLTIGYEYRKGFDAVLSIMNAVEDQDIETIDQAEIKKE